MNLSENLDFSILGFSKAAPQPPLVINVMPQPSSNNGDTKKKEKKKKPKKEKKTPVNKKPHQYQVKNPRYYPPYPYPMGNYDPRSHPDRPRLTNGNYDRYRRQEEKALMKSNGRYYPAPTKERWPVVYREEAGYGRGQKQTRSYHGVTAAAATGQKQNRFYPAETYGYGYGYGYGGYAVTRPHGNDTYRLQACDEEESDDDDEEESDEEDEEESDEDDEEEDEDEDEEEESDCEETVHRRGGERRRR